MSIRFQADPGDGAGGPAAPEPAPGPAPEPYPAPEPAAVEPAPEPATTAAAGLSWDSPELLDLVDQRAQQITQQQLEQLAPLFEQVLGPAAAGEPTATPGLGALDPLSETFGQDLQRLLASEREATINEMRTMFSSIQAPLEAREQEAAIQRGEDKLAGMLDDNISRLGDFPADPETGRSAKELVRPLADVLFPAIAELLGQTPRAAELAIEQAAQMVRDMGAMYARQGVNRETTRLSAIAGVHGEPGVGVNGVPTLPTARTPSEVTARHAAEARRLHAEGHTY
jgi:hypothetical protein